MPFSRGLSAGLLAWVLGVALQLQQRTLWPEAGYLMLMVAALLTLAVHWRAANARTHLAFISSHWRKALEAGALLGSIVVLSWAWSGLLACNRMQQPLAQGLEGRDLDVVGVVQAMAQRQDVGWRFRFRIEQAHLQGQAVAAPASVYLGWYAASAADTEAQATLPQVQPGERWRFRVRLKAAHGHLNPGGFDYELWLWEQGIRATGYVRQARADPPPERLGQTVSHPVEWARQQVRERLLTRLQAKHPQVAGILAALVTGDQAAIEREDWDVFRATGVAHLMSISGVHVTLLGWWLGGLASLLWRRSALWGGRGPLRWPAPQVGAVLGWLGAVAYAVFSGWGVPAQRTVWMLAVLVLLRLSGRDWPWRQVWALAAVVVLGFDPWALLQPGFWLSFVAVGVLMATTLRIEVHDARTAMVPGPFWVRWSVRAWVPVRRLLREQMVITVALLPLSVMFFGQFSLMGLPANLLAIPWVTLLVTPLALLGVALPWCWDLAAWCLQPLVAGLGHLSTLSWASVHLLMPPWPLAVLAMVGALALLWRGPMAWRVLGLPLLLPALLWQAPRPAEGQFELLAADVGQGNAVLVRTARHSLLYDAGPRYSPESDAGHRVLVPLLAHKGDTLDMLVLSHRDQDHIGGARAVLDMQPQAKMLTSLPEAHPLRERRDHDACAAGQSWTWDGVHFEVLHPDLQATGGGAGRRSSNASSCVLRIEAGGRSALLAGDIEASEERALVARGLVPVDFLLVPHHGSKTSSTEAFLQALQPRLALVQAGYRNRFGHPAAQVMARYDALAVPWIDSAHCGALLWQSQAPERWQCERERAHRYWHHTPP